MPRALLPYAVPVAAVTLLLSGCGSTAPAEPEFDVEAIEISLEGAEATAAGTELALGEVAYLTATDSSEQEYVFGISVLDVIEGDASFFDEFSNPEEFEGMTPYYIVYQYEWPSAEQHGSARLSPVLEGGSDGVYITNPEFGNTQASCPLMLPQLEGDRAIDCLVGGGEQGEEVVGARWYNLTGFEVFAPDPAENPYFENPIAWSK